MMHTLLVSTLTWLAVPLTGSLHYWYNPPAQPVACIATKIIVAAPALVGMIVLPVNMQAKARVK
jgi:hypothetical protein